MVSLESKRAAISAIKIKFTRLSTRSACKLLRLHQSTHYYQSQSKRSDDSLKEKIIELANKRAGDGRPTITWRLRERMGFKDNHKRIARLYRELGLQVGTRRSKRRKIERRFMFIAPTKPNEIWAMDFVLDSFKSGRRFRVLTVRDIFTREAVLLHADVSIRGDDVARALDTLKQTRGLPRTIVCDNGSEFISKAMDQWAFANAVELKFIQPGKPVQNAFIESFNGRFRSGCLSMNWFNDLQDVRSTIEDWRHEYNFERPNKPLGKETPAEFARRHGVTV